MMPSSRQADMQWLWERKKPRPKKKQASIRLRRASETALHSDVNDVPVVVFNIHKGRYIAELRSALNATFDSNVNDWPTKNQK